MVFEIKVVVIFGTGGAIMCRWVGKSFWAAGSVL